jgi:hypothetical protein
VRKVAATSAANRKLLARKERNSRRHKSSVRKRKKNTIEKRAYRPVK